MNKNKIILNQGNITWDERDQPISVNFDDVYFSKENGLKESEHVFLEGNRLADRFSSLKEHEQFCILETGFGTGLNFLATWQLFEKKIRSAARLEYISIEKYPLQAEQIKKALSPWTELAKYQAKLIEDYPPLPWANSQRFEFKSNNGSTLHLTLYFEDIQVAFKEMSPCSRLSSANLISRAAFGEEIPKVDAWFLDGFAPSKNPEMWSPQLFEYMAMLSASDSSFATFTAAGAVRRGLENVGFEVKKTRGFGRKREMLVGNYIPSKKPSRIAFCSDKTPPARSNMPTWLCKDTVESRARSQTVLVVGAGLAGSHIAFALAERGLKVTVLEKDDVASGASSNLQGAIYTRLSSSEDVLSRFNQQAQLYADNFYNRHKQFERFGDNCGVLHLCSSSKENKRLANFSKQFYTTEKFQFLQKDMASRIANFDLAYDALLVKNSGWLHPKQLCSDLLNHPNIQVFEQSKVEYLEQKKSGWRAHLNSKIFEADVCVVCSSREALDFEQSSHLPIRAIRGQVTHLDSAESLGDLKTVLCGEGYLCPSIHYGQQKLHSLGATFNLNDHSEALCEADHIRNLEGLSSICADQQLAENINISEQNPGKVGFRCTSPDYFPIVGPLPRLKELLDRFERLGKKANAKIDQCGDYYPGLYCSLAYGSRGLAYTPLASALLADLITGSYLPIARTTYAHLQPARFAIRSLIKNKRYGPQET